jgi:hypothetical protein
MINLILLSACVSLITLGILFIQRIRPQKIKIPSYFLGEAGQKRLFNLQTIPPRWWEWLLVLLATTGIAFAYYSHLKPEDESRSQGEGLVWFDPTLSHVAALQGSVEARESTLDALRAMRVNEYIFIELNYSSNSSNETQPQYQFKRVPASALGEYLQFVQNNPTALSQPLDPSLLLQSIKKELTVEVGRTTLTLVTDAQAETMRPLASLSSSFESVNVLRTPRTPKQLMGRRVSIVPEELAQVWASRGSESNEPGLPGTPQFMRVEGKLAGNIPPQARPTLSLEEFIEEGSTENLKQPTFSIFVGEETTSDSKNSPRSPQPLLTTCSLEFAGPAELDGMSDLRAYAQFFRIPVRPMACRSTESATSAKAAETLDPWKYRRASIWVIPVNEYVGGELFQQGLHWIPEGFSPETDALVYIADTRLQGADSFLESASLQLEENQPTIRMPLLPLPPAQIAFPWDLNAPQLRTKPRPIAVAKVPSELEMSPEQKGSSKYKTILKAADGTPLAYKLASQPPVIYLRTGGAAPNGELGRWGQWAGLWNELKVQMGQRSPLLTRIQMRTPSQWADWLATQKSSNAPDLRYRIKPETLKGALVENKKQAIQPVPALYIRERDDQIILVEAPSFERQAETLSNAELEQMFPRRSSSLAAAKNTRPKAASLQILGAIIALLSAIILWLMQSKVQNKSSSKPINSTLTLMLLILSLGISQKSFAQNQRRAPFDTRTQRGADNRPESSTHPFRIGWCDANIPEPVKQRYRQLQALLAGRGTIELPKELTPGACRVGAAEVWWTSSMDALQAAPVTQHIRSGGIVIAEGITLRQTPEWMLSGADPSIGLSWESPKRRGLLYRSFYLLSSFDGCTPERTLVLTLRKKVNAQSPMGIVTPARFLTNTSEGADCFISDDDYRTRSFVNMMYAFLTTDYKEDQMQLPEILNRVRNLGLEP